MSVVQGGPGMVNAGSSPRIVIIGANFAGLTTALQLPTTYATTVIDASPAFAYLPSIHELVSSLKRPEQLCLSLHRVLQRAGHCFVQDTVTNLDAAQGIVYTQSGKQIPFDIGVVAVGGITQTFGIPGADAFALPSRSVDNGATIGATLQRTLTQQARVSIVIVGGGLEGIEILGEVLRRYRTRAGLTIHLIESQNRLLPASPEALDRELRTLCRNYAVQVYCGTRVAEVTPTAVELVCGTRLPADVTIWTGGATAPPLLADVGLAPDGGSWGPVRPTLQSTRWDHIFIAGDAAELPKPISKQGAYAVEMGECVATNIARLSRGQSLIAFRPAMLPILTAFGDLETYLEFGALVLASPALAAAKEGVYQFYMARFDPPWSLPSLCSFQERLGPSLFARLLPTLLSPCDLLRLGQVRLLSC